jgi:hypothetical protein
MCLWRFASVKNDYLGGQFSRQRNDDLLRPSSLQSFCSSEAKTTRFRQSLFQRRLSSLLFGSIQLAVVFMMRVQRSSQPV